MMMALDNARASVKRSAPYLGCERKRSQAAKGFMQLGFTKLLIVFVVGSIAGLAIEVVYHAIVFGGYESRAGLVWGPFSPLYGFGAVALTVILNRFWQCNNIVIFLFALVVGSTIEFATSWGMEHFFGAIAWDYSGTFGNIQGRVNLMFALMWGFLGLVWVRIVMPLMEEGFSLIDLDAPFPKVASVAVTIFLVANIAVTVHAFDRERERVLGMPAATAIDEVFDEVFPSTWMKARFENMSIYGASELMGKDSIV